MILFILNTLKGFLFMATADTSKKKKERIRVSDNDDIRIGEIDSELRDLQAQMNTLRPELNQIKKNRANLRLKAEILGFYIMNKHQDQYHKYITLSDFKAHGIERILANKFDAIFEEDIKKAQKMQLE